MFEEGNRPWFVKSIQNLGWEVVDDDIYDLVIESLGGFTIELIHGDYLVLYRDKNGHFWTGEVFTEEDFSERFSVR